MKAISLHDFLEELGSFTEIDKTVMYTAKKSTMTTKTSSVLLDLVQGFQHGKYDNDIELLLQRTLNLINKN